MFTGLALIPGGSLEWAWLAFLASFALIAALAVRLVDVPVLRHGLLLSVYLPAFAALVVAAHALVGVEVFVLSPYAVVLVVSVLAAWSIAVPRLLSAGVPGRVVLYMIFGCLVLGVVGSRFANVLDGFRGGIDVLAVKMVERKSGLGVFGAVIVDSAFLFVLFRRYPELSIAAALDASATAIGVNVGLGRIGCLVGGCCYGAVARPGLFTMPAHAFQPDTPAGMAYRGLPDVHIWATQPLEGAAVLALTLGCEMLYRSRARLKLRKGTVVATLALGYGAVRAVLEVLRADSPRSVAGILTTWQIIGLLLSAGSACWLLTPSALGAVRRGDRRES